MSLNINILTAIQMASPVQAPKKTETLRTQKSSIGRADFKNELNKVSNTRQDKKNQSFDRIDKKIKKSSKPMVKEQKKRINDVSKNDNNSDKQVDKKVVENSHKDTVTSDLKKENIEPSNDTNEIKINKENELQELLMQLELITANNSNIPLDANSKQSLENLVQDIQSIMATLNETSENSKSLSPIDIQTSIKSLEKIFDAIQHTIKDNSLSENNLSSIIPQVDAIKNQVKDILVSNIQNDDIPLINKSEIEQTVDEIIDSADIKVVRDSNPIFESAKHIVKNNVEQSDLKGEQVVEQTEGTSIKKTTSESNQNSQQNMNKEAQTQITTGIIKEDTKPIDNNNSKVNFGVELEQIQNQSTSKSSTIVSKADKSFDIPKQEIVKQIVKKAEVILKDGKSEMNMKLEPESLGKITLKLAVEKGVVTAKFLAENVQVKEAIESNFNQLKDMLQQKGINIQSVSVHVGHDDRGFNSKNNMNLWKESIKNSVKKTVTVDYGEYGDYSVSSKNPYNYHDGKVDYKA